MFQLVSYDDRARFQKVSSGGKAGHHPPANEIPFKRCFVDVPMIA